MKGEEIPPKPRAKIIRDGGIDASKNLLRDEYEIVIMPLVINQDACMRMERFCITRNHTGTFGGKRVEGIGLRWRPALTCSQLQIEATKGHPDSPRN